MAEILQMLALSPTMEAGTINEWHFSEGDEVETGDILCEVETDKASMDYESSEAGTLLKILEQAGAEVEVGEPIAIVGEEGEDIDDLVEKARKKAKEESSDEDGEQEDQEGEAAEDGEEEQGEEEEKDKADKKKKKKAAKKKPSGKGADEGAGVSPAAARLAADKGVDLSSVEGSGPGGRIVLRDVEDAEPGSGGGGGAKGAPAPAATPKESELPVPIDESNEVKLSKTRQVIADRLAQSMRTAPHFFVTMRVEMDQLLEGRKRLNKHLEEKGEKIGVNEFLIKATALALRKHPKVNATFMGDHIVEHGAVNVALAVAQGEGEGLITPVVPNADKKSLRAISKDLADLIPRARDAKLSPEEYQSGTFTISNLGMYGVDEFTAIINPPQSAILAVAATQATPVVDAESGDIVVRQMMALTLSCDHRSVDGVAGALFLREIKAMLENPVTMLL